VYKPQIAFYEPFKEHGIRAFEETVRYAQSKGRIVICDAKRNDIADTAQAYADAFLGEVGLITGVIVPAFSVDALTVNYYLGSDCVKPFIEVCKRNGKGIFVLAKTSNPSSVELQDLELAEKHGGRKLFEQVALKMEILGRELVGDRGYSSLGLVVGASGATPEQVREQASKIRRLNSYSINLIPGYGQQGGMGKDVVPNFNREGYGGIVNNSRGIIFAYMKEPYKSKYRPDEFDKAARESALFMKDDIVGALKEASFKRWSQ
jgi:orotidine-5'-phosphate decarboxylase